MSAFTAQPSDLLLQSHLITSLPCSDIEVAMAHTPKNVATLANEIGVLDSELELYGKSKAKINLDILDRLAHRKDGKYVVVAGYADDHLQPSHN
jgi:methylenetetrahydrofolate dehydrogenase (NADP+)/methenyltetrahydrofolate cyclohydrolase/formyltetrahydrofolate synthetase